MSEDTREGVLSFRAISYSCRCTKKLSTKFALSMGGQEQLRYLESDRFVEIYQDVVFVNV